MFAEVDYRVSAELLDHPPVGSEVVVGRRQVGVVVDRDRVLSETPRRLDAHEDVSERETSHDELVAINVQIPRRPPPVLLDIALQFLWQPAKPLRVAFRTQASRVEVVQMPCMTATPSSSSAGTSHSSHSSGELDLLASDALDPPPARTVVIRQSTLSFSSSRPCTRPSGPAR